ncbi:MAG: terpene cyclase/mutase family protein, partial [Planctomycetota bacterium]|nr:terpene cyclase/mutase family protein [Planctomycetota bacterium]
MNIPIRRSYCPHCGYKVEVQFDQIAASVHEDAAARRGKQIELYLQFALAIVILAGVIIWCVNDYFEGQVRFDGELTPYVQAPPAAVPPLKPPASAYSDPFRFRPFGEAPVRGFGHRQEPFRSQLRNANGGDANTERAVSQALAFLSRKQNADGSWPVSARELPLEKDQDKTTATQWGRVGVSALALLAFLGDGHSWLPDAAGVEKSRYRDTVRKGVAFLLGEQDKTSGLVGPKEGNFMYNHGMATLALAEAYGMTGDPVVGESARKAVEYSLRFQREKGGWDYTDRAGLRVDSSVTAWHVQALIAARQAGIHVPQSALDRARKWFLDATDDRGVVAYDSNFDRQIFPSMLGVSLMIRQMLGDHITAPKMRDTREKLSAYLPKIDKAWGDSWKAKDKQDMEKRAVAFDPYRWYFAIYGQFMAGGTEWAEWNRTLKDALVSLQCKDGSFKPNDAWSGYGGI